MSFVIRHRDLEYNTYRPMKEPMWVDDTPVRPKPSPLIMLLLSRLG